MLFAAVMYGSIFGNLAAIVRSFDTHAAFDKTGEYSSPWVSPYGLY
jgi:hypothetical protein